MKITKRQLRKLIKETTGNTRIRKIARRAHRLLNEQDDQIDANMSSDLNDLAAAVKTLSTQGAGVRDKAYKFMKDAQAFANDPAVKAILIISQASSTIAAAAGKQEDEDFGAVFMKAVMGGPAAFVARIAEGAAEGDAEAQEVVDDIKKVTDKEFLSSFLRAVADEARGYGADPQSTDDPDEIIRMLKQVKNNPE